MNENHCGDGCEFGRLLKQEFDQHHQEFFGIKETVDRHDKAIRKNDTVVAVINTKLSAILWGVGTLAAALIGVLVKILFVG